MFASSIGIHTIKYIILSFGEGKVNLCFAIIAQNSLKNILSIPRVNLVLHDIPQEEASNPIFRPRIGDEDMRISNRKY